MTLGPPPSTRLPCPRCRAPFANIVVSSAGIYVCDNCYSTWKSRESYDITVLLLGVEDREVEDTGVGVGPEYLTDGGLKNDLNELARQSKVDILNLVRSQLEILDWEKTGVIPVLDLDSYLSRMIEDILNRRL